jgi:hypothetical protein
VCSLVLAWDDKIYNIMQKIYDVDDPIRSRQVLTRHART